MRDINLIGITWSQIIPAGIYFVVRIDYNPDAGWNTGIGSQ
jgi:hypothetical protein